MRTSKLWPKHLLAQEKEEEDKRGQKKTRKPDKREKTHHPQRMEASSGVAARLETSLAHLPGVFWDVASETLAAEPSLRSPPGFNTDSSGLFKSTPWWNCHEFKRQPNTPIKNTVNTHARDLTFDLQAKSSSVIVELETTLVHLHGDSGVQLVKPNNPNKLNVHQQTRHPPSTSTTSCDYGCSGLWLG